ncbi:MAG: helix-turn-helix domain-containing protein [Chloroflexota bacterium]
MNGHTASFGERLRHFRVRAGLSRAALAEQANLSPAAVTTLERGVRSLPHPRTVEALAAALDLSAPSELTWWPRPGSPHACGRRPRVPLSNPSPVCRGCRSG